MKKRDDSKEKMDVEHVDESLVQLIVEEGKKIAKEDFGKFSAIIAVVFTVGLWIVKSIWYAYMSGKFAVYKIDKSYINVDNENVFLEIIQYTSILIMWFFINYVYYKICVSQDQSRLKIKKKIKIFSFWFFEMFIVCCLVLYSTDNTFSELIGEVTIKNIITIIALLLFFCALINIYAIEFLVEEWVKKRKSKKNNQVNALEKKHEKRITDMFLPIVVTIALELILVFGISYQTEHDRKGYKLIMLQCNSDTENKYAIEYGENHTIYEIYPVAYENRDCYIVTRLFMDNGKIVIDYNYQRIVEKEGQETIYMQNIYDIGKE